MLFVSSFSLIIFFVVSLIGVIGLGVLSYLILISHEAKSLAEFILYLAIIMTGALILTLLSIIRKSAKKAKTLSGIIELARVTGIVAEDRLIAFGEMGHGLKILFRELTDISLKRGKRLFFMDVATNTLLASIEERIFVLDPVGIILYASEKALPEKLGNSADSIGKDITEYFPEFDFAEVATRASQEHSEITFNFERTTTICTPIFSQENEVDGFVIVLEKGKLFGATAPSIDSKPPETVEPPEVVSSPTKGKKRPFYKIFSKEK